MCYVKWDESLGSDYQNKENEKMADDMRSVQTVGGMMPDANVQQNAEAQPNV